VGRAPRHNSVTACPRARSPNALIAAEVRSPCGLAITNNHATGSVRHLLGMELERQ